MNEKKNPLLVNSEEAYQEVRRHIETFNALPKEEQKRIQEEEEEEEEEEEMLFARLRSNDRRRAKSREAGAHRVII